MSLEAFDNGCYLGSWHVKEQLNPMLDFTLKQYNSLLNALKKAGYSFSGLRITFCTPLIEV
jgi:hypothetical protein